MSPLKVKVGSYYNVPCIRDTLGNYVPILGPSHSDGPELCVTPTVFHYHYDYRFMKDNYLLSGIVDYGLAVTYRRLRCVRRVSNNGVALWGMTRLVRVYQNHTINLNNPVCPHQNIPIVNKSGQCSGHGLCWNLKTGRLKYSLPFYVRYKSTRHKELVSDRETIKLQNKTKKEIVNPIVQVIDANNHLVGSYQFQHVTILPNDQLHILTGCRK